MAAYLASMHTLPVCVLLDSNEWTNGSFVENKAGQCATLNRPNLDGGGKE